MPLADHPFRPDDHAAWLARKLAWDAEWAAKHPNPTTRGDAMLAALKAELEALIRDRTDSDEMPRYVMMRVSFARDLLAAVEADEARYAELLNEVAQKFVGESRHETARRYIRERDAARLPVTAGAER